ncbi:MAG: hypothetical protein JOS17DRAFT_818687 [Linnemannia elongata]|nr:MAG: hypothetical protein JOS17DRAFT_818687 [Linnemannia elongata]
MFYCYTQKQQTFFFALSHVGADCLYKPERFTVFPSSFSLGSLFIPSSCPPLPLCALLLSLVHTSSHTHPTYFHPFCTTHLSTRMAFTAHSGLLKFGFILTVVLFFCGLVALGSLVKYASQSVQLTKDTDYKVCVIFLSNEKQRPGMCTFADTTSALISVVAACLFAMDFTTWKKSENYKGRRASIASLFLAPAMCILSLCAAITLALGIKSTMNKVHDIYPDSTYPGLKGIYTGISCVAIAGLFFGIYASSEYVQYRRRHVNGDKW